MKLYPLTLMGNFHNSCLFAMNLASEFKKKTEAMTAFTNKKGSKYFSAILIMRSY